MNEPHVRWRGACTSRFAIPTAAVLAMVALVVAAALVPLLTWRGGVAVGAALLVVAVSVLAVTEIRGEVGDEGLRITYFPHLGWPRTTVRIEDVAGVRAGHVEPREHGGWGYRGSLRLYGRAALILRRGPGLFLELRDGRRFVVTLDDAEGAAAALGGPADTT